MYTGFVLLFLQLFCVFEHFHNKKLQFNNFWRCLQMWFFCLNQMKALFCIQRCILTQKSPYTHYSDFAGTLVHFPYLIPYFITPMMHWLGFSRLSCLPIIFSHLLQLLFNCAFWEIPFSHYITDFISHFVRAISLLKSLLCWLPSNLNLKSLHLTLLPCKPSCLTLTPLSPLLTFNHV